MRGRGRNDGGGEVVEGEREEEEEKMMVGCDGGRICPLSSTAARPNVSIPYGQ